MFHYFAYGLSIASDLALSGLPELTPHAGASADVAVRLSTVEKSGFSAQLTIAEQHTTGDEIRCFWPGAGYFALQAGRSITVEPLPQVTGATLAPFVTGAALAGILHQRGFLVLHASAVVADGRGWAFVGEKGWGKSTLAAYLQTRRHRLLSDDIIPLRVNANGPLTITPGFPQIKLWPDAVAAVGADATDLPRIVPFLEKRNYHPGDAGFSAQPVPLCGIYVLATGDDLSITPLPAQAAFIELVCHTYMRNYLAATGQTATHFQHYGHLAQTLPLYRLQRPHNLGLLPQVAALLERHWHETRNPARPLAQVSNGKR